MSKHSPRRGSLQYWPRKRARRSYARLRNYSNIAFAGYKVGMTHIMFVDNIPNSMTKGERISCPTTIIECPPLKPYSLRFYKKTPKGLQILSEIFTKTVDKELKRKIRPSKKEKESEYDELRLVVYTQPRLIGIKKKPELFEIPMKSPEQAKEFLNKEIKLSDIFKEGEFVDVHAITKGKGYQGTVKRYGVKTRHHKSEKTKRGIGTLGAWTPKKVLWQVPQPGKMGFHQRTEYNKLILKIDNKPELINPKSGFKRYGFIKNDYLLLKGSIIGSSKRLIILTKPARVKKEGVIPELSYIKK